MGLIRELIDEIIPLPKQADTIPLGDKEFASVYRVGYTFLNLIFQAIDCVIIPVLTYLIFSEAISVGLLRWPLIIVGGLASGFSILQALYYFIQPPENYRNPIQGRVFGETAIGAFVAAIISMEIKTFVK